MYKYFLTCICIFTLFFSRESFALNIPDPKVQLFRTVIEDIISLNKIFFTKKEYEIEPRLIRKRNHLIYQAKSLSQYIHSIQKIPTLDVSSRYRFALQKYKLSCEIALLRIVINSIRNSNLQEEDIFANIPIFSYPLSQEGIWGDPNKEFVGYYTGAQRLRTGYGVYEAPLQTYLDTQWGIKSHISNNTTEPNILPRDRIKKALKALQNGDHIILWGDWCTLPLYEDGVLSEVDEFVVTHFPISGKNVCIRPQEERILSWKTPEGNKIVGLSGEHVFLLLGYIGSLERPSHIIVWDSDTGRHIYPLKEWIRKWSLLDYRMLIINGENRY